MKKQTKESLKRKDLVQIAKICGLSEATLVRWWNGDLKVKPETETQIFAGAAEYYKSRKAEIKNWIIGLGVIEERIKTCKAQYTLVLREIKK